jgi:hypothetical protein
MAKPVVPSKTMPSRTDAATSISMPIRPVPLRLELKDGYQETVGGGQGFASLRFENGKMVILKDLRTGAVQELEEGSQLLTAGQAAPVKLGHVYVVRLTDRRDKSFTLYAKLIVVDYRPDQSVTIRWQVF